MEEPIIKAPGARARLVLLEFDGPHGWEQYVLPDKNALALAAAIVHKVPSITIYSYDNRDDNRQDNRNSQPDDARLYQAASTAHRDNDDAAA